MCGRYVTEDDISVDMGALYKEINSSYPGVKLKSGEIFPTDTVPLICGSEQIPCPGTWGYPGFNGKSVIINARAESVTEKPTFREGFLNYRCIVPTNGYFEWSKAKEKYRFNLPNSETVYLAGLYRVTPEGLRFVIITTSANDSVSQIHDRMPLILVGGAADAWAHSAKDAHDCLYSQMPQMNAVQTI